MYSVSSAACFQIKNYKKQASVSTMRFHQDDLIISVFFCVCLVLIF